MKIEYKGIEFDCEFNYEQSESDTGLSGGHVLTHVTLWYDDTELIDVLSLDAIQYFEQYEDGIRY